MAMNIAERIEVSTQIISHDATCVGHQYIVADDAGTEIVTVNNDCIGCTCEADKDFIVCTHIQIVEQQRAIDLEQARRRVAYVARFDPDGLNSL
jgi:hypothetical protein